LRWRGAITRIVSHCTTTIQQPRFITNYAGNNNDHHRLKKGGLEIGKGNSA